MKTPLLTVAVTALAGGLLLAPAMQESAQAQVYGGHGAAGTKSSGAIILVGKGGGGGGMRGGSFGGGGMRAGGGFKGGLSGGGMRAGGGGGFKGGLSRPGGSFKGAYRGSLKGYGGPRRSLGNMGSRSSMKGLKGRNLAASKHWNNGKWQGGKWKGKHGKHHRRYYPGYWWYAPVGLYAYDYGYGDCEWLRDRARFGGSSYWWRRYQQCLAYY